MNDKERLKDLKEQKRKLSNEINRLYIKQNMEKIKDHEIYIGKCYKHKIENRYYKVLSSYSSNEYRLTCLTFNLDNNIYNVKLKLKSFDFDFPNICVDFNMFEIDDVLVSETPIKMDFFDKVIEISQKEFDNAQEKMIEKFIKETNSINENINNMINERKKYYLMEEE